MESPPPKRHRDDSHDFVQSSALKASRTDAHWDRLFSSAQDERPKNHSHVGHSAGHPISPTSTPSHLQINYLAREHADDLLLLDPNVDALPSCVKLLNQYSSVLERSESLANNLGARPLSSILLQRFERMFDGPPRIVQLQNSYAKDASPSMSWFDVAEASSNPLNATELQDAESGKHVVQFTVKHATVQISWEEWQMVRSGLLQKMMPQQPVAEDEEKELGTLEILEDTVNRLITLADQVAARGRQLNHRARARKSAIVERRHTNARSPEVANGNGVTSTSSAMTRQELMRLLVAKRRNLSHALNPAAAPGTPPTHAFTPSNNPSKSNASIQHSSPAQTSSTQKPRRPPVPPAPEGPYKQMMSRKMERLPKGAQIDPPCDRCRRLQIECCKNLTACMGCTKKHCKCSWRDVNEEEVIRLGLTAHEQEYAGADSPRQVGHGKQEPDAQDETRDMRMALEASSESDEGEDLDYTNGQRSSDGYAAVPTTGVRQSDMGSTITIAGHDVPIGTPDVDIPLNNGRQTPTHE